jgi:nucleoside-diphosphate-sugar epimerase
METVLLTGATGFLGSHLLEGLLRETYTVVILKRTFSNTWRIKQLLANVIFYDVDTIPLEKVFKENRIDVIIHAATHYGRGEDYAKVIECNVLLPVRLLELSVSHGAGSFFNTDSFFNITNSQYKYLNGYSLSKKHLVEWLKFFSDKIQTVNFRLEHIYGPKDGAGKFVPWLIEKYIQNESEVKFTRGEQKRDFIYVSDVVDAFLLALKKRRMLSNYSEFEVGTGIGTSIRDFVTKAKKSVSGVSGKDVTTVLDFGAIPYRQGEIMESKADTHALKKLRWNSLVSLEDGLEETVREILIREKSKK